jgi:L-lactate dehydrogenase complex protein LldG
MATAKQEILGRIRRAIAVTGAARESEYAAITRGYRQNGSLDEEGRLELLADRLHDYEAGVYPCAEPDLRDTIAQVLSTRGKHRLIVARDLPREWMPDGFEFVVDKELSYQEIDRSEGVLTGCALAIASTGTIVLYHSGGEGRRALSLIPDYHLCVVHAHQVVETVPEGIRNTGSFKTFPLTTISGPSATADIEMTRIKGVHGPRTLDVILVRSAQSAAAANE